MAKASNIRRASNKVSRETPSIRSGTAPLAKFVRYPSNPRTHPPAQLALLSELLKRYGPDQDIVVDEKFVILKGHGRLDAAFIAGLTDFPYKQHLNLSEADKRAIRIADNQVALLSGWDRDLVRSEIVDLRAAGYDVALLGFGDAELVQFEKLPGPPADFKSFGADIETQHSCPRCGFRWSGNSAPKEEDQVPKQSVSRRQGSGGKSGKGPKPPRT